MHEYTINLHMHTTYSDGTGSHDDIAKAAIQAGLDAVIVTDHNIWVDGPEGYHRVGGNQVLMLVGEEIHDTTRVPEKNHMLTFGGHKELSQHAREPQGLIDAINAEGALSFLAHPSDPAAPAVGQGDLSWVDWDIEGFTGIELWNGLSEFKTYIKSKLHAVYYAFSPQRIGKGPLEEVLAKWDELLSKGKKVVAVGGSDAHALKASMGPIRRTLFPYEFHFRCVNTHILTPEPFNGELEHDRSLVYDALRKGHAWVGYDLPASTEGFRFKAQGIEDTVIMGDSISAKHGVTFQVKLPQKVEARLIKDGKVVADWGPREYHTYLTAEPGAYRVEARIPFKGSERGWIFSNPIYVEDRSSGNRWSRRY
jgi:hypothetical protein